MDDDERESGEIQYRNESRDMQLGNYKVEFNLYNGKFDVLEDIRTGENLMDRDLYKKVGDKFIKLDDYLIEKIREVYGD